MDAAALHFDATTHTYTVGGRVLPSVTQVLHPLSQFARWSDDWLAAAAERGRQVHEATQFFDEDDLDEGSVAPDIAGYLAAWKAFRRDYDFTPLLVERRVWHPRLGYAGTLDRYGAWTETQGRRRVRVTGLIDIKSGAADPTHGPQTAAYLEAARLAEPDVAAAARRRAAVYLRANGKYKFQSFDDAGDFPLFVAALTCHHFRERHGLR